MVALRIKGKGSVFHDIPVPGRLSAALLEWKNIQEGFKALRIMAPGGIGFAGSQFVFAGYSGEPFSDRASTCGCAACRAIGAGEIQRTGCGIPRLRSSSITPKRICGKFRNCSPTRISAPRCAIPTSAASDPADCGGA